METVHNMSSSQTPSLALPPPQPPWVIGSGVQLRQTPHVEIPVTSKIMFFTSYFGNAAMSGLTRRKTVQLVPTSAYKHEFLVQPGRRSREIAGWPPWSIRRAAGSAMGLRLEASMTQDCIKMALKRCPQCCSTGAFVWSTDLNR